MAHKAELGLLASALAQELGVGIGRAGMGVVEELKLQS